MSLGAVRGAEAGDAPLGEARRCHLAPSEARRGGDAPLGEARRCHLAPSEAPRAATRHLARRCHLAPSGARRPPTPGGARCPPGRVDAVERHALAAGVDHPAVAEVDAHVIDVARLALRPAIAEEDEVSLARATRSAPARCAARATCRRSCARAARGRRGGCTRPGRSSRSRPLRATRRPTRTAHRSARPPPAVRACARYRLPAATAPTASPARTGSRCRPAAAPSKARRRRPIASPRPALAVPGSRAWAGGCSAARACAPRSRCRLLAADRARPRATRPSPPLPCRADRARARMRDAGRRWSPARPDAPGPQARWRRGLLPPCATDRPS